MHSSYVNGIEKVILSVGSSIPISVSPPLTTYPTLSATELLLFLSTGGFWSLLPGNEIINTCFLDFKSISTPCFSILINSLFRNFGKVYMLQFKESSAWLLLMFFVGRTSTLRYTELYPRATTSNSWRSFLRRIQVGFFVFCNVFHIFVM